MLRKIIEFEAKVDDLTYRKEQVIKRLQELVQRIETSEHITLVRLEIEEEWT